MGTLERFGRREELGRRRAQGTPLGRGPYLSAPDTARALAIPSQAVSKATLKQAMAALARRGIAQRAPTIARILATVPGADDQAKVLRDAIRTIGVTKARLIARGDRSRQLVVEFHYRGRLLARYHGRMLNDSPSPNLLSDQTQGIGGPGVTASFDEDSVVDWDEYATEEQALDYLGQTLALEAEADELESMEYEGFDAYVAAGGDGGLASFRSERRAIEGAPILRLCGVHSDAARSKAKSCLDKHRAALAALYGFRSGVEKISQRILSSLGKLTYAKGFWRVMYNLRWLEADIIAGVGASFLVGYAIGTSLDCLFNFSGSVVRGGRPADREPRIPKFLAARRDAGGVPTANGGQAGFSSFRVSAGARAGHRGTYDSPRRGIRRRLPDHGEYVI